MAVEINPTRTCKGDQEANSPMMLSNSRDEISVEQDVDHSSIMDKKSPVANSMLPKHDVDVDKHDKNPDNIANDNSQCKNERSLFIDVDISERSPTKHMDESDNLHLSGAEDSPCKSNDNAPHLRRSQRASAKRAHDLIKGEARQEMIFNYKKEENAVKPRKASVLENGEPESDENMEKSTPRKLVDPLTIDASDAHFAVQMTESGTVVVLSEESDISSLHTKEIDFLRKNFEKLKYKELTEEQLTERDRMIQELKTHLRIEEARLSFIKRVRQIQKLAHKDINQVHGSQATAHSVARNNGLSNSNLPRPPAYKPPVATLPQQQGARTMNSKQLPGSLNHGIRSNSGAAQVVANAAAMNMHKHSTSTSGPQSAAPNAASSMHQKNSFLNDAAQQRQSQLTDGQTLAQREAAAKLAWRRQMEKTLLQIPPPKPPPAELHFVPNPNQPDFLYLVGLDEIVERILAAKENHLLKSQQKLAAAAEKAAIAEKKNDQTQPSTTAATATTASQSKKIVSARKRVLEGVENEPYSCAQCSTDYTPTWKKVDKDGRIMCEQCVRSNQKKALRIAHTNLLREKFGEALKQEREIERQIKDGTFNFASLAGNDASPLSIRGTTSATPTLTSRGSAANVLSASSAANTLTKQPPIIHQPPRHSASTNHLGHSTSSSSSSKHQNLSSTNAAAAAALAAAASNPSAAFNNFGNMSSMMAAAQMLGVNWNPLLTQAAAAAAAGRYSTTGNAAANASNPMALRQNWQAAIAAAAAAAASATSSASQSTSSATAAATKEILKNMQQMQQQQQQQALQRQIYLDMMPRTQKWK